MEEAQNPPGASNRVISEPLNKEKPITVGRAQQHKAPHSRLACTSHDMNMRTNYTTNIYKHVRPKMFLTIITVVLCIYAMLMLLCGCNLFIYMTNFTKHPLTYARQLPRQLLCIVYMNTTLYQLYTLTASITQFHY